MAPFSFLVRNVLAPQGGHVIDEKLKAAIEKALSSGCRVQLKQMKDGSIKAQVIKAEELKK